MRVLKNIVFLSFLFSLIIFSQAGERGKQPKNLVITEARLIDGTGSPAQENIVIVITNDKFAAIRPKGKVAIPKEAEIIDVKGKTVIPGLIGTHVHFTYPSKEEIKAAIEETHAWERFVTVHSGMFKEQYDFVGWAVEAGPDCIEHA